MSWLMAKVYDRFMAETEAACLREWRGALLSHAGGEVLEVGAGTGANIAHYTGDVTRVVFAEPDGHMRSLLIDRLSNAAFRHDVVDWPAEQLHAETESFDTVVCTLVLCTVTDPDASLREIRRVLRPGGSLLFLEHVAADEESSRYRWQRRLEPLWRPAAGGCHLTRRTEERIVAAGFTFEDLRRESMRKALPIVRPTIRGVAV